MKRSYRIIKEERYDCSDRETFDHLMDWVENYKIELTEHRLKSFILKIYSDVVARKNHSDIIKDIFEGEEYERLRDVMEND